MIPTTKVTDNMSVMREWNPEDGGVSIVMSYGLPVAGRGPSGLFRTEEYYSKTTTRHINKFFTSHFVLNQKRDIEVVSQEFLDQLLTTTINNHNHNQEL